MAVPEMLTGTPGNDTLTGGDGADTLLGNLGNDVFVIALAADHAAGESIDGGPGLDAIRFTSTTPEDTLTLTALVSGIETVAIATAAGVLTGTISLNVNAINLGSAITLIGNAGANALTGGAGNDSLVGNAGNDTLFGYLGNNTMLGGAGNDTYYLDSNSDVVIDSAGIDTVLAGVNYTLGAALENLTLNYAVAALIGPAGGLVGTGNALANVINGGEGDDTLMGNAGNDTLDGGSGNDLLVGGAGNDYLVRDSVDDSTVEILGGGTDTVEVSYGDDMDLLVDFPNIENLVMANASGVGSGTAAANVLTSKNGAHTLHGGLGNDTYNVQAGDIASEDSLGGGTKDLVNVFLDLGETYTLGAGIENMTLTAGGQDIIGNGNELANLITGGAFNDRLNGGAGNDTLSGGAGADTLDGGGGKNSLAGGLGDDRYFATLINPTPTTVALDAAITDTGGIDALIVTAGEAVFIPATFNLALNAAIENLDFSGVDGQNLIATGNALANKITGNWGNNKIDGGAGNDSLDGGDGSDTLLGSAGDDTLFGGFGNDTLNGGAGNDYYVDYTPGSDVLAEVANGGIDVLEFQNAGSGTFNVSDYAQLFIEGVALNFAEAGTANGTDSANFLASLNGNHTLAGGLGNDTYSRHAGDSITDDGGIDTVISSDSYALEPGIENAQLSGSEDNRYLVANELANKLTGSVGADMLYGDGNNTLIGGAGDDTLYGGPGKDSLSGGAGNDVYVIDLVKFGEKWVLQNEFFSDTGGIDTLLVQGGDEEELFAPAVVTLLTGIENLDLSLVSMSVYKVTGNGNAANNFITGRMDSSNELHGLGGNDTLSGVGTYNWLDGGAGNDVYISSAGSDVFYIDQIGDSIVNAGGGSEYIDIVRVSVSGSSYLNLTGDNSFLNWVTYRGAGAVTLTGNDNENRIEGNTGNDTLFGGAGRDDLIGGGGKDSMTGGTDGDTFVIDRVGTLVKIADFEQGLDLVGIAWHVPAFDALFPEGFLEGGRLVNGTAGDLPQAQLVYNGAIGALYYDSNGSGAGGAVQIASFDANHRPANLTEGDFLQYIGTP